jgi:hypothetical protein
MMSPTTCRTALVLVLLALVALTTLAPKAEACPFCDGGPDGVNEVRDGIFDEHFWPRVAAIIAPFPVLAGIVALIYFGPPTFRRAGRGTADTTAPVTRPSPH